LIIWKAGGQFLQFGVAPMGAKIEIEPYKIFRYDWTILGSFALSYTFQPAIDWLASGAVDVVNWSVTLYRCANLARRSTCLARGKPSKFTSICKPAKEA
jgi:threonine dehydrogenase-like Zn-dependent dehydrogenase